MVKLEVKNILVTGGSGKIGRSLLPELLKAGYDKPDIGIEFTLKYGWAQEEIVYDFLKLLDRKNPFTTSISFNVIFRQIRLVKGGDLRDLEEHMNDAIEEVDKRLGYGVFNDSKEIHLIVTEIDQNNNRRHWHYYNASSRFENGLPFIG